ncbi:hypothetical protein [Mycobacterium sp. BK086]|uniref:hypothetical protein n=1 Tax=Mycobacterium sp. BK086 TaxID=2512165 RepID=UPI00105C09C6|nr:hypothetical protein [Mycobacterium sp. BK086]
MVLSVADIDRWSADSVREVFYAAQQRAAAARDAAEGLAGLGAFATWDGTAAEAARQAVGRTRVDLDAHGSEAAAVARAAGKAADDIEAIKRRLADLRAEAARLGMQIDAATSTVVAGPGIKNPMELLLKTEQLQPKLTAILADANTVDTELATAIEMADGKRPIPAGAGTGRPAAPPGQGAPPAQSGKPPTLQDMLTGNDASTDPTADEHTPGSLPWMLDQMHKPVPGQAPHPISQQEIDQFKGVARQVMLRDGVPADQIEQRLDAMMAAARRPLPAYTPPTPEPMPPPGFGEGFADRWFDTEQGVKNLLGQGGPGAPGVLESWEGLLKSTNDQVTNPFGTVAGEVKEALDSPSAAYYLGGKSADAAIAAPGMVFGGEGALVSRGLGEIGPGVLEKGPVVSPHAPIGLDTPGSYTSWADQAAADLRHAFEHGGPVRGLAEQVADLSTHYVGENPDRVVLGRFVNQDEGYIGDARGLSGIYFDTGDPTWDAITQGLSKSDANALAWRVNEQFLRNQMESQVGRIDYLLDHAEYSSLEEMAQARRGTFSAMEIDYLNNNAAAYGYRRVGDSWVYEGG